MEVQPHPARPVQLHEVLLVSLVVDFDVTVRPLTCKELQAVHDIRELLLGNLVAHEAQKRVLQADVFVSLRALT